MRSGKRQVPGTIRFVAGTISTQVNFVRDVQIGLSVPDCTGALVFEIPLAQLRQRLDWSRWAQTREPSIEIPFHSILQNDRAVLILTFTVRGTGADSPAIVILLWIRIDRARDDRGINDDCAESFEHINRFGHDLCPILIQGAVEGPARNAD